MPTLPLIVATALMIGPAALAGAAPPAVIPPLDQMIDMAGSYALPNGRVAQLSVDDARLYIDLGGQQEELVPVAPGRYATRDGSLTLRYRPGPRRDDIMLDYWVTPRPVQGAHLAALDRWGRGSTH
jgi:hypothetical protein